LGGTVSRWTAMAMCYAAGGFSEQFGGPPPQFRAAPQATVDPAG